MAKTEVPHETPFIPGATVLISETWFPSTVLVCLLTQAQRFLPFAPEQVGLPCALSRAPHPPPRLRRPLPPGSASGPAAPLAPAPRRSTRWPSSTHPQTSRPLRRATVTAMLAGSPPPRPPDGHARRGQPGERGSLQAELPGPLLLFCLLQPMVSQSSSCVLFGLNCVLLQAVTSRP